MTDNYFFGFYKVGDKKTTKGKEYLALKDGDPVCYLPQYQKDIKYKRDKILNSKMYIDKSYEIKLSKQTKKVYCIIK